jgi:hypothetical protein
MTQFAENARAVESEPATLLEPDILGNPEERGEI